MKKDTIFYKEFFTLYIALVLQNVVTLSVNLADNIMLGAYSETSLAGVAAANQIQFVYQMLLGAFGEGMVILGSQYWGKRQTEPMKKIAAMMMQHGLAVMAVLFCVISLFPKWAIGLFTTDAAIISEGAEYLGIIRFTYLFFAVTQLLLAVLRSMQVVKIALYLSAMAFFVNCGINYTLIFGHFGAPELGTAGAAVGTLIARILETTVLILYIVKTEKNLCMKVKDFFRFDRQLWKDYIKVTAPILFTNGLWGVNTAMQTAILGHMTAAAIAANSAASNLFLLVKSTAVGASSAAGVLIGKAIGYGDMDRVKCYARRLQKLFLGIGICSGILLFFLRIPVLSLYDLQPETKAMANTFLIILSVVDVGMSYQMPANTGIIRGGGDTMFVVKMDLISIWLIVLPLSFFMAFVVKASPAVVVCCLNADQLFKCVPAFLRCNSWKWIHRLTRELDDGESEKWKS